MITYFALIFCYVPDRMPPPLTLCGIRDSSELLVQTIYLVMAFIILAVGAIIGYLLTRHHSDAFSIKKEFFWCLISTSVAFIGYFITWVITENAPLAAFWTILLIHGIIITSLVWPAMMSYRELKTIKVQVPLSSMSQVLKNDCARDAFLFYLQSEFSSENLLFWIDANNFRLLDVENVDAVKERAYEICRKYLTDGSPCQINLQHGIRERVASFLKEFELQGTLSADYLTAFDEAQNEVENLMAGDSFLRFQRTSQFREISIPDGTPQSRHSQISSLKEELPERLAEGDVPISDLKLAVDPMTPKEEFA